MHRFLGMLLSFLPKINYIFNRKNRIKNDNNNNDMCCHENNVNVEQNNVAKISKILRLFKS